MSAAVWNETQWAEPPAEPPRSGRTRPSTEARRAALGPRDPRVASAAGAAVCVLADSAG
jgi:hypothetical protein